MHRADAWPITSIVVAVLSCALVACGERPAPAAKPPVPVKTATALATPSTTELVLSADIQPRYESNLGFRVPGKVVQRLVDAGETVQAGKVLAKLDTQDLRLAADAAEAALEQARNQQRLAAEEASRYRTLLANELIAKADFDRKASALGVADDQVRSFQAALQQARNAVQYGTLVADASGVVTAVLAEAGQVVTAGQTIVQIARNSETEAQAFVPENKIRQLRIGQPATVTVAGDSSSFAGKVREIASVADPATRTYRVRVSLSSEADVRLGMSARVAVSVGQAGKADGDAFVPMTSIVGDRAKPYVLVIGPDSKAAPREVSLQQVSGSDWVLVKGIKPGETIIAAGAQFVQIGDVVSPIKRRGGSPA